MGNSYRIMCLNCKEYLFLGKENEWYSNKELMYLLKDFLLSHTNHFLKVGGDEWNCSYTLDKKGIIELPTKDFKEFNSKYSKQDFNSANPEKVVKGK